jgi:hypothetical protein
MAGVVIELPCGGQCQKCEISPWSLGVCKEDSKDSDGAAKSCFLDPNEKCFADAPQGTCEYGSCVDKRKCENNECEKCDENNNPVPDPGKNGSNCALPAVMGKNTGFCKDGACLKKTCENLGMGVTCGTSATMNCCGNDQQCLPEASNPNAVCCNKGETARSIDIPGPGGVIYTFYTCQATNDSCKDKKDANGNPMTICPVLLPPSMYGQGECCSSTDKCVTAILPSGLPAYWYCGQEAGTCGSDKTKCGNTALGDLCCDNNTEICYPNVPLPNDLGTVPMCGLICGEATGTYLCGNDGLIDICCKTGLEACVLQPHQPPWPVPAIYQCVNNATPVGPTSKTSSFSVYLVRARAAFSLNGEAYVITPHLKFKKPVTVTMKSYDPLRFETYKYASEEAVLKNCENVLLGSVTKTISAASGGIIVFPSTSSSGVKKSLEHEVVITIPPGALEKDTAVRIEKYDLKKCFVPGSRNAGPRLTGIKT